MQKVRWVRYSTNLVTQIPLPHNKHIQRTHHSFQVSKFKNNNTHTHTTKQSHNHTLYPHTQLYCNNDTSTNHQVLSCTYKSTQNWPKPKKSSKYQHYRIFTCGNPQMMIFCILKQCTGKVTQYMQLSFGNKSTTVQYWLLVSKYYKL